MLMKILRFIRNVWQSRLCIQITLILAAIGSALILLTIIISHVEMKTHVGLLEYEMELMSSDIRKISAMCLPNNEQLATGIRRLRRSEISMKFNLYRRMEQFEANLRLLTDNFEEIQLQPYLDRSGRADFALESSGARIISIGNTQLLTSSNAFDIFLSHFNVKPNIITLNGPRNIIQPSIYPGECFAFVGEGEVSIRLVRTVYIDTISIEHILPEMSVDATILGAPNEFSVYGRTFENETSSVHLGTFNYDIVRRQPLQNFGLDRGLTKECFSIVDFKFLSNHGQKDYTCVYRVRVHGTINKPD